MTIDLLEKEVIRNAILSRIPELPLLRRLPEKYVCGLAFTHDIDTLYAYEYGIRNISDLEEEMNIRSLWNFITDNRRYKIQKKDLEALSKSGHEVGMHGHTHTPFYRNIPAKIASKKIRDGKHFLEKMAGKEIKTFRAPSYSRSFQLIKVLDNVGFRYDSSCQDISVLGGEVFTLTPFEYVNTNIVELPVAAPDDLQLFVDLKLSESKAMRIIKKKIDVAKTLNGIFAINIHPDHDSCGGEHLGFYEKILGHVTSQKDTYVDIPSNILGRWEYASNVRGRWVYDGRNVRVQTKKECNFSTVSKERMLRYTMFQKQIDNIEGSPLTRRAGGLLK
jgi:peptidoglycan/xylan/chitin deacetylase (PgdA/CDA1 family)